MPGILVRDGQPIELVLRLMKKQVEKSGVMRDIKNHEYYEKPSIKKKKKRAAARKRVAKQKQKEAGSRL